MDETAALTPGAHRTIRLLDAQESAYAGELITDGERRGVRVDAEAVAEQLWILAGAEHVAGVRDVLRRADGHDAVLPWCSNRIEAFLGRRAAAENPLSTGEAVTLVGSLLRGIVEIGERSITGQWWLTDEGRPVFAPGEGVGCTEAAVALIARVREACSDRAMNRVLGEIAAASGDQRVVRRSIKRWERALTELAAPRPLQQEVFAPERVVAIDAHAARLHQDADLLAGEPRARHRLENRLLEAGEMVRARLEAFRRRPAAVAVREGAGERPARVSRGRLLVIGAAAAAVVLGAGLMWPAAEEDSVATAQVAEADPGVASSTASDARAESDTGYPVPIDQVASPAAPDARQGQHADAPPAQAPNAVADGSAEQHAAALLTTLRECARKGDAVCADAVADGAAAAAQERLAGTDAKRTISAVEDYGDVSVLRLGPSGERGEQMLVLVMQKDRWLVRDVYDVVNQPPGQR